MKKKLCLFLVSIFLFLFFLIGLLFSSAANTEPDNRPIGLPYDRAVHGFPLTNGYWADRKYGTHHAWDIALPEGTPVFSIIEGTAQVKANKACGLFLIIENDTYRVGFYHLLEPLILSGQKVRRGDFVAFSGNSGSESQGAHLHYFIEKFDPKLKRWIRVNPNDYVK
ncbi:M23 family metallopeptidase [Polynucleobacter sp.]|uniref:M23 family metallopeptidase n=1 Tax=Polynucleobacter sp. TaxID=2029855 RepID=UPI003F6A09EB